MAGRAWKSSAVHVAVSLALFAILKFLVAGAQDLEAFAPIVWREAFEAMGVPSPADAPAAAPAVGLIAINMKSAGISPLVVPVFTLIMAVLSFLVALLTHRWGRTNAPALAPVITVDIDPITSALIDTPDTNTRDAEAQIQPRIDEASCLENEENWQASDASEPAPAPAPEASNKSGPAPAPATHVMQ